MNTLHVLILSIIEGVTEFLPVSSTAHLILAGKVFNIAPTAFYKTFEITIQLGAILAVVILYWRSFFTKFEVLKRVVTAFISTAVLGFIFYKLFRDFLEHTYISIIALFIGGAFFLVFEKMYKQKMPAPDDADGKQNIETLPLKKVFFVGIAQALAMIPGVSRSGAAIIGGMFLGFKRENAVEFSFLLAVPTMLAASAFDLYKQGSSFSASEYNLLIIGFIGAFLTALLAISWFLKFIKTHTFISFGIYRIVIAALAFLFLTI